MDSGKGGRTFFGWRVVAATFVLAIFGWGMGFYGPSVYLQALHAERGWSVSLLGAAVTCHFLLGVLVIPALPALYARLGVPLVTTAGATALSVGIVGWAFASSPWQLFAATVLTGGGWVTMGAAAVNAIVSPWFDKDRPKALSTAYNGASVGGILLTPLWAFLIERLGFRLSAVILAVCTVAVIAALSRLAFASSPAVLGQAPDGRSPDGPGPTPPLRTGPPTPLRELVRRRRFRTLAGGMALGLFAQIGILAHLFSLLVPSLGASVASLVMAMATASAIAGRTAFGWIMGEGTDRRRAAAASYAIQIAGLACLATSGGREWLVVAGVALFGFGIGNATSLPPLVAQREFEKQDTARVVALIVAIAQAAYAMAPVVFGLVRAKPEIIGMPELPAVCLAAGGVMALAIACFLHGAGGEADTGGPALAVRRQGTRRTATAREGTVPASPGIDT